MANFCKIISLRVFASCQFCLFIVCQNYFELLQDYQLASFRVVPILPFPNPTDLKAGMSCQTCTASTFQISPNISEHISKYLQTFQDISKHFVPNFKMYPNICDTFQNVFKLFMSYLQEFCDIFQTFVTHRYLQTSNIYLRILWHISKYLQTFKNMYFNILHFRLKV